ncbi:MAG: ROK family protein, partial [bacterium]|nr:ROK family protein [bacterium]
MDKMIIGVDLGGTRIRAARMNAHLDILERVETLTLAETGPEATLNRIKEQIRRVMPTDKNQIEGIGISAPGPLNPETGVIYTPPNLNGWYHVPLKAILEEEFGIPVYAGNDANVAALAEAVRGAGRGYRHIIYLTISTGIGSGMIIDDRLLLGHEGLGAEAGHMMMIVGDRVSSLEMEAAGPDMAMQAVNRIRAGEKSSMYDMVHGELGQINAKILSDAAHAGDALARSIVARSGYIIGLGIVSLLHIFNPQIVIVGGGVANMGDMLFMPMREAVEKHCLDQAYWKDLIITQPQL